MSTWAVGLVCLWIGVAFGMVIQRELEWLQHRDQPAPSCGARLIRGERRNFIECDHCDRYWPADSAPALGGCRRLRVARPDPRRER